MHANFRHVQVIWYGANWRRWYIGLHRVKGDLRLVYRLVIWLGPIEVRVRSPL